MSGIHIGEINTLPVSRLHALGAFLEGGDAGEVLLPRQQVPANCQPGDRLDVFVFRDGDGQLSATTSKPLAQVGQVAWLKVVATSRAGAFLDWGLPKDLLCPFAEQRAEMEVGKRYLVMVFLDDQYRVAASARIDEFLEDDNGGAFAEGQEVSLMVADRTPLGFKAVINNSHWGVLYASELFRPLHKGQAVTGYIRRIRHDGRIDLTLQKPGGTRSQVEQLADAILAQAHAQGGYLPFNDKTPPEEIYSRFAVSKKIFKQAVGHLLKEKLITLCDEGVNVVK